MPRKDKGRPRLPAAARVERDRRIVELRDLERLTFPEIAARLSIDVKTAQRRYRETVGAIEAGELPGVSVDVPAAVARIVRVHLLALGRLEELVEEAEQSNQGVGTLRAATAVSAGFLDVLERTGYLSDAHEVRQLLEVREVARRMAGAVREFERSVGALDIPEELHEAAAEVVWTFEDAIAPPKPTLRVVS